jgi:hypothetical protein
MPAFRRMPHFLPNTMQETYSYVFFNGLCLHNVHGLLFFYTEEAVYSVRNSDQVINPSHFVVFTFV